MQTAPLVSVIVVAYQQQKYVRQCLDSILAQQTNFPFEIIIGEDGSQDGTREICLEYANKHPDTIKLFLRSRSDVIYIDGKPTGRYNFMQCFSESRGEYVAFCEGDDFWTDTTKLQRQFEIMNTDTSLSFCYHECEVINGEGVLQNIIRCTKPVNTIYDIIKPQPWVAMSSSLFFRKKFVLQLPDWFKVVKGGDFALQLLFADKGNFYCLNKCMSCYRRHNAGISQVFYQTPGLHEKKLIELYRYFDVETAGTYHSEIEVCIAALKREYEKKVVSNILNTNTSLAHAVDFLKHRLNIDIKPWLIYYAGRKVTKL